MENEKPLKILSSHLALRFYENQGWTEEKVRSYMVRGSIQSSRDKFGDTFAPYWIGDVGTCYDVDRILADGIGVRDYRDNELHGEEARVYLSGMNW